MKVLSVRHPSWGDLGWLAIAAGKERLSFGGTRVSAAVTREEVETLARAMHEKLGLHGQPTGGAKAGICLDPLDPHLLEKARSFGESAREWLTTSVVLGKDMGASDALIGAIYEGAGVPQLHVIQKRADACPDRISDLAGYRRHMTGLGVAWATEAALGSLEGQTVLVQGRGVVGNGSGVRLEEAGARVIGSSDVHGACVEGAELPREALLSRTADVLVLAASSNSVDAELAQTIHAPLVVEGANFALTPEARQVLYSRGIRVVPDCIASSSSAALVAHQLARGNGADSDGVWKGIRDCIQGSVVAGMRGAQQEGISLREFHLRTLASAWATLQES